MTIAKKKDIETAQYQYDTMNEMMQHIGTMAADGWDLVSVSSVALTAEYEKSLM